MGGRYLVTGVQLTMLKTFTIDPYDIEPFKTLVDDILRDQFVMDSKGDIVEDSKLLRKCLKVIYDLIKEE
jgi:hypothetical protein